MEVCKLCGAELDLYSVAKKLYCPVCHNVQEVEEEEWIIN